MAHIRLTTTLKSEREALQTGVVGRSYVRTVTVSQLATTTRQVFNAMRVKCITLVSRLVTERAACGDTRTTGGACGCADGSPLTGIRCSAHHGSRASPPSTAHNNGEPHFPRLAEGTYQQAVVLRCFLLWRVGCPAKSANGCFIRRDRQQRVVSERSCVEKPAARLFDLGNVG